MSISIRTGLAMIAVLGWLPFGAQAHQSSNSFLRLQSQESQVDGRWDIALRDLDVVLGLDADGDGQLRWGEVRGSRDVIVAYASQALQLATSAPCVIDWQPGLELEAHADGHYAVLRFHADCTPPLAQLNVHYTLFAEADAGHRGLVSYQSGAGSNAGTVTAVAGPASPDLRLTAETSFRHGLAQYFVTGVEHIWSGYDHILFLLSLLLPAVLVRAGGRWQAQQSLRTALFEVFSVVTAFTVAHSLTLGLAAFGVLRVPARLSESAIALSVLLAALNNLMPQVQRRRWLVAFAFGLVHGFGFANVLNDLALPPGLLTLALLGFNLGVEAGQLVIVLCFVPLAFALRDTRFYRQAMVPAGSGVIAVVATLWLIERALDLKWAWMP